MQYNNVNYRSVRTKQKLPNGYVKPPALTCKDCSQEFFGRRSRRLCNTCRGKKYKKYYDTRYWKGYKEWMKEEKKKELRINIP